MIPLPPHSTKGPGALGAEGSDRVEPFGRYPDPREDEGHDDSAGEDPFSEPSSGVACHLVRRSLTVPRFCGTEKS